MNGARNAHADRAGASTGLASWYVPGHADGFGDRLLMFDNTSTPSLELLRFHRELTAVAGFEDALRERVQRLSSFRHDAFAPVRTVQYLDDGTALALVSEHAQGQRLSEIYNQRPRTGLNPAIVTWLLRELTPALAALHDDGEGVAHGALTPDRIVLTPEGRLCIVEHVLGSALGALNRTPSALWRDFSVIAPPDILGVARLDAATDVSQLAAIALSMLLARPMSLQEYQHRVPALLDEFSEAASTPALIHHVSPLRLWLERALQVDGSGYQSAADAEYDVRQLPSHEDRSPTVSVVRQLPSAPSSDRPATTDGEAESPSRPLLRSVPKPEEPRVPAPDREPLEAFPSEENVAAPTSPAVTVLTAAEASVPRAASLPIMSPGNPAPPVPQRSMERNLPRATPPPSERGRSYLVVAMAFAIVAQTAVIGLLVTRPAPVPSTALVIESSQPGDTVIINGKPAGRTPLPLQVGTDIKSVLVKSSAPLGVPTSGNVEPEVAAARREPVKSAGDSIVPTRPKFGGVRLSSPIELKVFEGNEAVGASGDGPIALSPGSHTLDVVNAQVGYRSQQTVTIKPGETVSLKITPPDGLLSVNAQPWANCSIDRKEIGETPLANVKVALGPHELVCRHPKLGEQRMPVLVRSGEVSRVSVKFDQ
jgi:serine/threonine protein kinase